MTPAMRRRDFVHSLPGAAMLAAAGPVSGAGTPTAAMAGAEPSASNMTGEAPSAEWARIRGAVPMKEHSETRRAAALRRAADKRPNILFLFTDQQTFHALSAAGNAHVRTPNMDFLARRGVRFERCYCQSPVCGPSRASLLTSRMPHETGVRFNEMAMDSSLPTFGHVLREAGYDTTWVGKWHLPKSYPAEPEIQGFHYLPLPPDLQGKGFGDATDMHKAQAASAYLRWHAGLSAKPWCLGVSLHNPHDICAYFPPAANVFTCPEPDPDVEPEGGLPLPPLPGNFARAADEPEFLKVRRGEGEMGMMPSMSKTHWRKYLQTYYHMTQSVDRCLAPILAALAAGGWRDNTLIVFASDHGEGMASHEWFTKLCFYECVARVPLIVVPPGQVDAQGPRVESRRLASLADVMPTILDYAGVPRERWPVHRGHSLRPCIEGRDKEGAAPEFVVSHLDPSPKRPESTARMIVTRDGWKYCRYSHGDRPEQLFELTIDPGETKNVAFKEDAAGARGRLLGLLRGWCAETGDPFAAHLPKT